MFRIDLLLLLLTKNIGWSSMLLVACAAHGVDYGIIRFIVHTIEKFHPHHLSRWKSLLSYEVGDKYVVPLMGACLVAVVSTSRPTDWYLNIWWHRMVMVGSILIVVICEYNQIRAKHRPVWNILLPSAIWHHIIWPILLYVFVSTAPIGLSNIFWHPQLNTVQFWASLGELISALCYFYTVYKDGVTKRPKEENAWVHLRLKKGKK